LSTTPATSSTPSGPDSLSPDSPSSGTSARASVPTPRKELVILITAGWALVTVFVLTVVGATLPIQPRNLAWSQNLSRLIVDAGSLAVVGLCLVRYGTYLRSLDLPSRESLAASLRRAGRLPISKTGQAPSGNLLTRLIARLFSKSPSQPPRDPFAVDQLVKDKLAMERNKLWVRRLAIAGALGMLLLAPLQVVLFLRGTAALDLQFAQASVQQSEQFKQLETALKDAPAQQIQQGWLQFKQLDPANPPAGLPSAASQLDDLLAEATSSRDGNLQNLQRQASNARFALGRDTLRVLLASLVYGWAFWAFFRRA
jgi:hypothetical protein